MAHDSALEAFSRPVARWFGQRFGTPTEAQRRAWPVIAAGRNVLVTAPTGSGKTLTAFLWALDRLMTGAWEGGRVRALYVSPLKALNSDIQRNLLMPLAELEKAFSAVGRPAQSVRIRTRSGDTPARDRQAMLRHPPEILITTPESLNLLVTSPRGRLVLGDLACVILDEIHAVAGSKRGVHLMTAVERLVPLAGDFQRLALSATVRPVETIARFVGGWRLEGREGSRTFTPRRVEVVAAAADKRYDIQVCLPDAVAHRVGEEREELGPLAANLWEGLAEEFKRRIRANRSTLVFANNRRTTEKLTRFLNEGEAAGFVYSHHGSLSREIRSIVERRLRKGELKGLVATNSLELGIDIGTLDEVLLVKTPPTVASAVQRIGRSGHGVGQVSRGRIFPLFGRDILEAAVVARAVLEHDIEEIRPIEGALDVLAQVILGMTANDTWRVDDLFDHLRASFPYRHLSRQQFELVLEMLTGRYADSRVRELSPRLRWDRIDDTVAGRPGTARLVYQSGGTIPDRGYFHLRLHETMAKLGELDEEFVWERSLGDTFSFGTQTWRIRQITHNDVLVSPASKTAAMAPFWRAEERDRSFHLSRRIGDFLAAAETVLAGRDGGERLRAFLEDEHQMSAAAARALVDLLEGQRSATGVELPHRHHLVAEWVRSGGEGGRRLVLHTGWGGRVNRPFAIALAAAWEARYGASPQLEHDSDCLLLTVPRGLEIDEILGLVRSDTLDGLLRRRLETTGFFGARFRENAGRALLLPRSGRRRRVALWLQRERAKKLLSAVGRYEDFPIVVETWRACLNDEFDREALKGLLDELAAGSIRVSETVTDTPSPLAGDLVWKQTNRLMYEDDTPEAGAGGGVSRGLLREVVFSSSLRPPIPDSVIRVFEAKAQRTHPGYAPRSVAEVVDWVEERVLIPEAEWLQLAECVERETSDDVADLLEQAARRLVRVSFGEPAVAAVQVAARLATALDRKPQELSLESLVPGAEAPELPRGGRRGRKDEAVEQIIAEWSRFYGPWEAERIEELFGLGSGRVEALLESLAEAETIVVDRFREGSNQPVEVCDSDNLERLLRQVRARSRPAFAARPLAELPLFLAVHQGLVGELADLEDLKRALDRLLLYPAPVRAWESDILPARLDPYHPEWLDNLLQETELAWQGCGRERLCFLFPPDRDLLGPGSEDAASEKALKGLFLDPAGRYGFEELSRGEESAELTKRLWGWSWRGSVSNTAFSTVRRGAMTRFSAAVDAQAASAARRRRSRFDRWQSTRPFTGDWFRVPRARPPADELEGEELNKERARILIDRYGVVFRELVSRELPALGWARVFRSLRLMELSGEVVTGQFFSDLPGPQFASHAAFRRLSEGLAQDCVYWMSAADPASPCGLRLEATRGLFPARVPSNHLVFHGLRPVILSRRGGARLDIRVAPDHPDAGRYFDFLRVRLTRRFDPQRSIDVESINGQPARDSPYATLLSELFSVTRERSGLRLRRRY